MAFVTVALPYYTCFIIIILIILLYCSYIYINIWAFGQVELKILLGINCKVEFNFFFLLHTGMSRGDLLEMQRIMRERQQEDYKRKAGMKLDETKGVRYHSINP